MKYIYTFLLLLFFLNDTAAQNRARVGYFNKTKLGFLVRAEEKPEQTGFSRNGNGTEISTINGFYVSDKVGLGIGLGISSYVNPTLTSIPLYADFHYYFGSQAKSPFLFLDCGYSFFTKKNFDGGLIINSGVGYSMKLSGKTRINPELGFRKQNYGITAGSYNIDASITSVSMGVSVLF